MSAKTAAKQGRNGAAKRTMSDAEREKLRSDTRSFVEDLRLSQADQVDLGRAVKAYQLRCQLHKMIATMSDRDFLRLVENVSDDPNGPDGGTSLLRLVGVA